MKVSCESAASVYIQVESHSISADYSLFYRFSLIFFDDLRPLLPSDDFVAMAVYCDFAQSSVIINAANERDRVIR